VADQHRGGGAGDAGHAVVLGQPEALVAQLLGVLRQRERVAKRLGGVAAFGDGGEVEDGERLGQSVVIDNRGGGNGTIGLVALMQAAPDGYTLAVGAAGPMAVNPSLYEKLPYDPLRDFAPITNMVNFPLLLVTHPACRSRP
jgi:tripartite-type tricarboxylate transporter receptor subunit TctC